ncbi:MAG TPA: glycosyltransferase [Rhizomicrobium sp.]|jgi:lipopolysaccharide biosynthesis glycosyltransferase/thioredoxin-like negative regulator of GroEL|nr:glycosyltransferase [Rhizomicrobium sp.]
MQAVQNLVEVGNAIALRHDKSAASNLLITYPPPPDLNGLDAPALRAWGDIAYTADADDLAVSFYLRLAEADPASHWPTFQIGRVMLRSDDYAGAAEHLSRAATLEPSFGWTWFELCRCYFNLKDVAKLAYAALGFAAAERVQLLPPHIRLLADAANFLFERKLREEPFGIYSILLEQGCTDDIVRTRHAEYFIWKQDFQTAIDLLRPHWEAKTLGDWGVRALAQAYREIGDFGSAASLLAEIVRKNPRNLAYARDNLKLLCQQNKFDEAADFFSQARSQLPDRAHVELKIIYLSETAQFEELLNTLDASPQVSGHGMIESLDRAIGQCAYRERNFAVAARLIEHRIARFGTNDHVALCRLNVAFGSRNWNQVERCFAEIPPESFARNIEFRMRQFEYFCHSGRISDAQKALAALGPVSQLPRKFLLPVLRFYGELGDWSSVARVGLETLDYAFDFGEMGHLLTRAIRKTGSCDAAARRIDGLLTKRDSPSLVKLRLAIAEDREIEALAPRLAPGIGTDDFAPLCQRAIFKRLVEGLEIPDIAASKKFAIYYCTDAGYLGPSLVSLLSLLESNPDLTAEADLFMLVDGAEAMALARRAIERICASGNGAAVSVLAREDILDSKESLKTAYGMFTGGETLAEACYYRIFFAKYLRQQQRHQTALYIDSDTIVQGDISPLFHRRPSGALLARLEVTRPEVTAAIARHQLEAGKYFNSGILSFDLTHAYLDEALDSTLSTVRDRKEQLMFQDQCALNIGFRGAFCELDPKYNHFISPFDASPSASGAVLHFLDRPKPWDTAYGGNLCRIWFLHWYKLARRIGRDDAMALLRLTS